MNRLKVPIANSARVVIGLVIGLVIVAIGLQVNWSLLPSVWAQDESRAGLVIQHGDGSVITQCVRFPGVSTSGYNLLDASGLDLNFEVSGGVGVSICRIDNEGCSFPQDQCFCECTGVPCTYWNYWKKDADEWVHSSLGAVASVVVDGDVDAWTWSAVDDLPDAPDTPPPSYTFADICEPRTIYLPIVNK